MLEERYSRSILLPEIQEAGQERLLSSRVVVVGCGALGTVIASSLVRAGVGHTVIVDRDYVELSNLQRQVLFDEDDIGQGLPKAVAAVRKLHRVNSQVRVEPMVADINPDNVVSLIGDAHLVLDGTDNLETRLLLNDACLKLGIPWVYGAVVSTHGMCMAIVPHETPCFRCLVPRLPPPGYAPTCDTAGVLGPAASVIASLQATEGMKLLLGKRDQLLPGLTYVDVWTGKMELMRLGKASTPCPACDLGRFEFLEGGGGSSAVVLCGQGAVQIGARAVSGGSAHLSLPELAERLQRLGRVSHNEYMLRFRAGPHELVLFPDGRAIVKGTSDPSLARALYSRYVGL